VHSSLVIRSVLGVAALAACGDPGGSDQAVAVRDSAGIQIVENLGPADSATFGSLLDLDRAQSFPELELAYVRGMVLLADGRVVIANAYTSQLFFLTPSTGQSVAVGRRGDGPGEFAAFLGVYRCAGDSVAVLSFPNRLTVLDQNGSLGRAGPAISFRPHNSAGVASDCATSAFVRTDLPPNYQPGDPVSHVVLWAPPGNAPLIEVATRGGDETTPSRGLPVPVRRPYGSEDTWLVAGLQLHLGRTDTAEIRTYRLDGGLERITRWRGTRRPVTSADEARYTEKLLAMQADRGDPMLAVLGLDRITLPAEKPHFARILADADGNLWVQRYPELPHVFDNQGYAIFGPEGRFWWIFSPAGRLLGTGTTPEDFIIHDIRDGMVAGVRRDADGVEVATLIPLSATARQALSRSR